MKAPGNDREVLPSSAEVLAGGTQLEHRLKGTLGYWCKVAKTVTAKWLELASGQPESSIYKHMDPEVSNALPIRTLDAAILGDKQGAGVAIIGALAERWGFTWAWKIVQRGRRPRDMFRQILQAQSAGTESTMPPARRRASGLK